MISVFVKEQQRYTQEELANHIFKCHNNLQVIQFIQKLKELGVLKTIANFNQQQSKSDLSYEDTTITDVESEDNSCLYVFTFVGVIVIKNIVLKCYPKYISKNSKPINELKQIIKVLEKYNATTQDEGSCNDLNSNNSFNLLAVMLFLLHDYFEHGVYSSTENIVEVNGSGEILWDKSINESFAILVNQKPYYMELRTRKNTKNNVDFFTRLHQCVLTSISEQLQQSELLSLFELTQVEISDELLEDLGDTDYLLSRIAQELNVQFNTRKQLLLKTIANYIERTSRDSDYKEFTLFGSNNFHIVWEKVCSSVMDNQLNNTLGSLSLPITLLSNYDPQQKLINLIEKPLWTFTGQCASDTLIPDLVSIYKVKVSSSQSQQLEHKTNNDYETNRTDTEQYKFVIFDAKYYNPILQEKTKPAKQPGIESVVKQYLYQLAFSKFISDHKFSVVENCFLLPTEHDQIENKGKVILSMLSNLGLKDIKVRFIPATTIFDLYLTDKKLDIEILNL